MWYIIVIIALVIGLITGVGCNVLNKKTKIENVNNPKDSTPEVYSKAEIEDMLKKLSKSNPKNLETIGAMCYEMAALPERVEYVCPVCGEKTLYTNNYHYTKLIAWDLEQMRQIVAGLKGIDIKLDESQFCKNCSPNIGEPQLCLIVTLEGEKEHKTCGIIMFDIKILSDFLNGSEVYKGFYDEETPLKEYIPRIEELLGVKMK